MDMVIFIYGYAHILMHYNRLSILFYGSFKLSFSEFSVIKAKVGWNSTAFSTKPTAAWSLEKGGIQCEMSSIMIDFVGAPIPVYINVEIISQINQ